MPGSPRTLLRQLLGILACALASLVSAAQDGTQNALQIELVSRDARLIDVTVAAGHVGTIELSLSNESVSLRLGPGEPPVRLRLDPGGTIRASAAGEGRFDTGWFDPFAELVGDPAAEETPEWALGAVWYNVFPERFENGNPLNDQGWPYGTDIPWDQPWFESSADEFEASANRAIASPRRYADSFSRGRPPLREGVFERRFGGDLQGVERRLGHIRDLGATVIWFCPIFESTSLHKYDAGDYRHIDPHLAHPRSPSGDRSLFSDDPDDWEWTPADRYFVDRFLPAAREKGLRIVLDGVWNHVGLTHPTFVDALKRGPASPYFGWYDITADRSGRPASWRAWDRRNGALPEFHQANGDLHPGVRSHVFDVTKRWMDPDGDGDPADGIDGWRLDVANEIGMRFWADWRSLVRSINPGSVLVGELWFDGADYFEGRAFDSQMNYPLAFALTSWLGGQPAFSDADLVAAFDRVLSHAPATDMAQVNLLGSHDTARFVTMLDYPSPDYDRGLPAGAADRGPPSDEAIDKLVLAFATLVALPGSPMVYAGDELGMWGADDPENRKPLDWRSTGDEQTPGPGPLFDRLQAVFALRGHPEAGPALRFGSAAWSSAGGVVRVERRLNGTVVRASLNRSEDPVFDGRITVPSFASVFEWKPHGETEWRHLHSTGSESDD